MNEPVINASAIEPLFAPHEEPNSHRVRAEKAGEPANIAKGRRPSPITIVNNLRPSLKTWRESDYAGASDTTRELLQHWFERDHTVETPEGIRIPFRYYFCQREAIEALIYLYEVLSLNTLSSVVSEFGGDDSFTAALGVDPKEDYWAKYAFKMATGSGKTKVMSLAIVWSYFHALRESNSTMAKNFVVIAPNLTVFERLKEDFGNGMIFDNDPLIPVAWRGDWNLSVVLQDEASGAATGGTLYLTNIHRLYDTSKRKAKKEAETYSWMGPPVSKQTALDTAKALRERITSHERIMVLNDEAHHLWDPDNAWNEAIDFLHDEIKKSRDGGIVAQLDFTATPKDNKGRIFQHVVCDTPLGEAVDSGIVKTPIIGRSDDLSERASDDASEKFDQHLRMGYERWLKSKEEWEKSGKKPLLFVMTESTDAADQIAKRLNTDPVFQELNGKTINLHINLKGKIEWKGGKKNKYPVFIENEKEIKDEDLRELRKLSRELDSGQSPYQCIVSVLMLREGWDVRNVTTIVPLRPYTAKSNILPEQTLGRGLRRMTSSGDVAELVTVVEHPAFVSLYQEQLSQEGLDIEVVDVEKVPRTTVTIYPDVANKDKDRLDIALPSISPGYTRTPTIENLTIEDIKKAFSKFKPLPLGKKGNEKIEYVGRHLITDEVVEKMEINIPLLESGMGAISYYRQEIEYITKLRGTHKVLAPLLETFITEILFEENVDLFDERLLRRLADDDVKEHIRATFVPLVRSKTTVVKERKAQGEDRPVSGWKPFQATHSENHPALPANRTIFNLVPCNREFEVAMTQFLDRAQDVKTFCKNAGPQALRLDYLSLKGRLSLYTPDFIAKIDDTTYLLIETKGREDRDVPLKARAAVEWCEAASQGKENWIYVYVPQGVFERLTDNKLANLAKMCEPSLSELVEEMEAPQLSLPFGEADEEIKSEVSDFISTEKFEEMPPRYKKAIAQAVTLYQFLQNKENVSFSPVFTPLLGPIDEASRGLIIRKLENDVPDNRSAQNNYFYPDLSELPDGEANFHKTQATNLRRTLVDRTGLMPIGLLRWCLDYVQSTRREIGGVFASVRRNFNDLSDNELFEIIDNIYSFRNEYIAHQERELSNPELARRALGVWAKALHRIWSTD